MKVSSRYISAERGPFDFDYAKMRKGGNTAGKIKPWALSVWFGGVHRGFIQNTISMTPAREFEHPQPQRLFTSFKLLWLRSPLATFPERGSHPRELLVLGIRDYHRTVFEPYRMICHVAVQGVYVYLSDLPSKKNRRQKGARRPVVEPEAH